MNIEEKAEHICYVLNFIGWNPANSVWGNVTQEQAFKSFCELVGIEPKTAMGIVRMETKTDDETKA